MCVTFRTDIFTQFVLYSFQLTPKKPQKIKKTIEKIMKHVKESLLVAGRTENG